MIKFLLTVLLLSSHHLLSSQTLFVEKGKIEFEKKVNLHKEIDSWRDNDEGGGAWLEEMKKKIPQFRVSYYNLYFNKAKTLYRPGREVAREPAVPDWFSGTANDNIVYSDFDQEKTTAQKTFFDNTFLITDSIRHLDWRITSELRKIAGFDCHKAVGRIMDSVYVIAFYTDQIITPGGPESFCGLPGMILGLAIPRINTSWFATKVDMTEVKPADIVIPSKGKPVNNAELLKQLESSLKDWGKNWQRNVWKVML